jgi:hypothetical protein
MHVARALLLVYTNSKKKMLWISFLEINLGVSWIPASKFLKVSLYIYIYRACSAGRFSTCFGLFPLTQHYSIYEPDNLDPIWGVVVLCSFCSLWEASHHAYNVSAQFMQYESAQLQYESAQPESPKSSCVPGTRGRTNKRYMATFSPCVKDHYTPQTIHNDARHGEGPLHRVLFIGHTSSTFAMSNTRHTATQSVLMACTFLTAASQCVMVGPTWR